MTKYTIDKEVKVEYKLTVSFYCMTILKNSEIKVACFYHSFFSWTENIANLTLLMREHHFPQPYHG